MISVELTLYKYQNHLLTHPDCEDSISNSALLPLEGGEEKAHRHTVFHELEKQINPHTGKTQYFIHNRWLKTKKKFTCQNAFKTSTRQRFFTKLKDDGYGELQRPLYTRNNCCYIESSFLDSKNAVESPKL